MCVRRRVWWLFRQRSPDSPLNRNGGKVGTPPLPLPVGPGKQGVPYKGEFFRLVLWNLPSIDLENTFIK